MRTKILGAAVVVLLLVLVFTAIAQAAVPQSVIDSIIKDAKDGTIDGNWSSAEIRAALAYLQANPAYEQYSNLRGVLEDFLASLQAPGAQGGELAFTGGEVLLLLGAGVALIGGGSLLRRSRA
ncbi:MAG TPA: hypothetical protein PLE63_02660 [Thermoleophilia bacterium]|nr:hypothetical protein [Thermoleophilia bacterium]